MKKMSIIIPVYNEEQNLNKLILELNKLRKKLNKLSITYIFVDDCSEDNSLKKLKKFSKKMKNIKIISFSKNFGHQAAITAGMNYCYDDYVVTIDADLQDPPMIISKLYQKALKGYDVVYAVREERKGESFFKKITANIFYSFFNYLSDTQIPKNVGDFRLINKKVLNEFHKLTEKNKFIRGLIPWIGFKSSKVFYSRDKRYAGVTKYPLVKMIKLAVSGSISFSSKIINFMTGLSLLIVSLSFLYGSYLAIYKLLFNDKIIPGFTAITVLLIFFSGMILFFLSIIGQYIIKIHDEVKDRPEYIIKYKNKI